MHVRVRVSACVSACLLLLDGELPDEKTCGREAAVAIIIMQLMLCLVEVEQGLTTL